MNQQINNTQIITILVSVVFILFVHYTITHSSCEYFGVGSGRGGGAGPSQGPGAATTTTTNYYTSAPVKYNVANNVMQQFLTKVTDVVYKYSNKQYSDQTMSSNGNVMNTVMNMVQTMTLKDIMRKNADDINSYISAMKYIP